MFRKKKKKSKKHEGDLASRAELGEDKTLWIRQLTSEL